MVDSSKLSNQKIRSMGFDNTLLVLLPDGPLREIIGKGTEAANVRLLEADDGTDLIAMPGFIVIADPSLMTASDWEALCEAYEAMDDQATKFLFVRPPERANKLPAFNYLKGPIPDLDEEIVTADDIKFLLLRVRAAYAQRTALYLRPEKRIVRLMYMLRQLETEPPLLLMDVAKEFETSVRTIQRDLQVLLMAGHPINGPDENGGYWLPGGYKAHSLY